MTAADRVGPLDEPLPAGPGSGAGAPRGAEPRSGWACSHREALEYRFPFCSWCGRAVQAPPATRGGAPEPGGVGSPSPKPAGGAAPAPPAGAGPRATLRVHAAVTEPDGGTLRELSWTLERQERFIVWLDGARVLDTDTATFGEFLGESKSRPREGSPLEPAAPGPGSPGFACGVKWCYRLCYLCSWRDKFPTCEDGQRAFDDHLELAHSRTRE